MLPEFVPAPATQGEAAAARSASMDADLVRLNPIGSHMDADRQTVIGAIKQMRAQSKGIIGMKILGQGDMRSPPDEAIHFALGTGVPSAQKTTANRPI
jgi:hypothetical protein